jgi:hypothetical protein
VRSANSNISNGSGIKPVPDPIATQPTEIIRSPTMTDTATRKGAEFTPPIPRRPYSVALLSVMLALTVVGSHGVTTAARAGGKAAAVEAVPINLAPLNLAGRWKGPRYAHNMRAPDPANCGGKPCELTYDIVACPDGWCGIAVSDAAPCGPIAVHLKPDTTAKRPNRFNGHLELAKDTAPYTVEAWFSAADPRAGEGSGTLNLAHLHFVGDTGDGGMLMMRRSFPFQAELARIGDAQCTLEKATS